MRASPLGVWGASRSDEEIAAVASADARLSHPNPSCVAAASAYAIAVASLVRAPGDAATAIARASAYLETAPDADEVRGWLADALAGVLVPYEPLIGFVKIAFTHAFRHLAAGTRYPDAVRETLAGGGDTDTNACIVGGLVGARWGCAAVPVAMREAVLACDTSRGAHARPDDLHPRAAPELVRAILRPSGAPRGA
jgi:ADP-ribosylglycohydrolase